MEYLTRAKEIWNRGAVFRSRRLRMKRYTFGDQWGDVVRDKDGFPVVERELLQQLNHHPATNNVIRQLVKTVVGCYRTRRKEAGETEHGETDARTFEEFLISGCAIHRVSHQIGSDGREYHVEQVNPSRFFIDLGDDGSAELLGELHDMTLDRIVMRHSHGSRQKAAFIRRTYESGTLRGERGTATLLGESSCDGIGFGTAPAGKERLIETWSFETRERLRCHDPKSGQFYYLGLHEAQTVNAENRRRARSRQPAIRTRWEITGDWHCRFLAPSGAVIDEYRAGSHPYAFKFYPLIDGEIHSFVEDLIEHQRNINRLLTLNDRVLSTAAKGVLLFPDNQKSAQMSLEETAEGWTSPDGIVLYRAMPGMPGPQQVVSSPSNLGINGMVEQQLKLIEEVSGVSGALKGSAPSTTTAAAHYESQRESALTALTDLFDTFDSFTAERDALLKRLRS